MGKRHRRSSKKTRAAHAQPGAIAQAQQSAHLCREDKSCTCSLTATEPKETCYVHGSPPYPPRCEVCGRILKRITLAPKE